MLYAYHIVVDVFSVIACASWNELGCIILYVLFCVSSVVAHK